MKQRISWPLVLKAGLLCGVTVLAVLIVLDQLKNKHSPRFEGAVASENASEPPKGPAMSIASEKLATAGKERSDNELKMVLCWSPPGTFQMGGVPGHPGLTWATNQVDVTLPKGFWIGKFEVTQDQWKRVMGVTLAEQRAKDVDQPRPVGDGTDREHVGEGPEYPIYYVSHGDAEEFCRKLTETERKAGRLKQGDEYRLPTEAQWEYACRAGTTTTTAFGDKLDSEKANFDGAKPYNGAPAGPYLHDTTPVGRYPANAWGLHDMHGNVWEWCRDGYSEKVAGGADPVGDASSSKSKWSYRGGCWHNPGSLCVSTSRFWGETNDRGSSLGLRVVLIAAGP